MVVKEVDLLELKLAVHDALEKAFKHRSDIGGAVNWGDLGCRETRRSVNDAGEIFYTAYVEEASPTAYELQKFVRDALTTKGFPMVEVETEW